MSTPRSSARWSAASRSSCNAGHALHHRDVQDARVRASCGTRSRASRYGVTDPKQRRFRYGVQVNSLGLTEQQPENNVYRILHRDAGGDAVARTRAPAPCSFRPGTRRSACRGRGTSNGRCACSRSSPSRPTCSNTATSSTGSTVIESKVGGAQGARRARNSTRILGDGRRGRRGRERLHEVAARREPTPAALEAIERGEQIVVGVNRFTETEPSPLAAGDGAILTVPPEVEAEQIATLQAWRAARDAKAVRRRSPTLRARPRKRAPTSCRPRSPAPRPASPPANGARRCARCFGEYRAPTGVSPRRAQRRQRHRRSARRGRRASTQKLGRRPKFLVGKPGLDGHSNGAEQIARARARRRHGRGL